uniref:F-box domain-containing protein n=1 Tax=Caenorhabditis tropicalis TaxID=1561998 RepID=A0A1I7TVM9_9PELO
MIVKNLDLPRRVKVSRVCKTLREIVNGLKPPRCNEIRMNVSLERCEMIAEGYPIEYERPEGENLEECLEKMMEEMFDDMLIFVSDLHLPILSARFNDKLSNRIFRSVAKKRFKKPLTIPSIFIKAFSGMHIYQLLCVAEIHYMEKLEDDVMRVEVSRNKYTGEEGNRWESCTKEISFKYFREGQEDIYVDESYYLLRKTSRWNSEI